MTGLVDELFGRTLHLVVSLKSGDDPAAVARTVQDALAALRASGRLGEPSDSERQLSARLDPSPATISEQVANTHTPGLRDAVDALRDALVSLRDSGVLGDGVFQVNQPLLDGEQPSHDRPEAQPAILGRGVDEQQSGLHLGQQHALDLRDDVTVRIAHDDSSTAQGRPESALSITVEVRRRGGGDSRPCASCGGAK